jgi:hypothetical protein
MKKLLLLFFAIITLATVEAQKGHLGFKAGLNISNLQYKDGDATDFKAGLLAGLLTHIHVTKKFAIQPEVVYSQQGGISQIGNIEHKTNLHYVNVPVLAQYMFGKGFRLEAGPQVGFLVAAREKFSTPNVDIKANDAYKKVDYSLAVGLGFLTHAKIGFDARWVFGLRDISNGGNSITNGAPTYNNGAQLSIFYQFDHRGAK